MDSITTISGLKDIVKRFCEERDWDQFHSPKELAIGLSTEANELLQLFRFKTEEQMKKQIACNESREKITQELADVFFFVLRFAQMNNIDLSDTLKRKMELNAEKYPVEKVRGRNEKYNEY